jgi:hypothetical protein
VAATDEIAPERRRTSARVVNWSGHPNESADRKCARTTVGYSHPAGVTMTRFTPIYGVDTEGPSFSWSLDEYSRFILAERLLATVRAKHDVFGIVDAAAERGCKLMAGMST